MIRNEKVREMVEEWYNSIQRPAKWLLPIPTRGEITDLISRIEEVLSADTDARDDQNAEMFHRGFKAGEQAGRADIEVSEREAFDAGWKKGVAWTRNMNDVYGEEANRMADSHDYLKSKEGK